MFLRHMGFYEQESQAIMFWWLINGFNINQFQKKKKEKMVLIHERIHCIREDSISEAEYSILGKHDL